MNRGDDFLVRDVAVIRRNERGLEEMDIGEDSVLCVNCKRSINEEIRRIEEDPTCLRLNVLKQTDSRSFLICNARNNVQRLSVESRVFDIINRGIYVPENAQCCQVHLDDDGNIVTALLPGLRSKNRPYICKGAILQTFLQQLRVDVVKAGNTRINEVMAGNLGIDDFKIIIPINKEQFEELYTFCGPVPEGDRMRLVSKRDLLVFLCKMRQGLSDDFFKVSFNYPTRQSVSAVVAKVRQSLMQRFVPANIGFRSLTREEHIDEHVTPFANILCKSNPERRQAIVYVDGTYSPKSRNFRSLRQSHCQHKHRHLLKPALVVAPDWYILDIQGPYFSDSRNNDAAMLQNEYERDVQYK